MRILKIIFYIIIIIFGITFSLLNHNDVRVDLFLATYTLPLSLLLVASLSIGLIFGFIFAQAKYWKLKIAYKRQKNQLKLATQENSNATNNHSSQYNS